MKPLESVILNWATMVFMVALFYGLFGGLYWMLGGFVGLVAIYIVKVGFRD